jgi:hypothetical protein
VTVPRIAVYADWWEQRLDLPGIAINHVFIESSHDDDDTAATTDCRWPYRSAEIKWYVPVCAGMDDVSLEATVVHELVHVLLGVIDDRLKAGSDEHIEHATQNVACALLAVRNAFRGDL